MLDRRGIGGKKVKRKPMLKNQNKPWIKRNICKERSTGKGSGQTLAKSGEGFGRHDMRRER